METTRVVDSRPADGGRAIRRRRRCTVCGQRFTTFERAQIEIMVVKRDGHRQPFESAKVRRGVESALADRPVPADAVDELVRSIEADVRSGPGSVRVEDIGLAVLAGLRRIDEVAYLRFASVYKDFQGAQDFEREMATLEGDG